MNKGNSLTSSYRDALELFEDRVFNYNSDKLLLSDYAQKTSVPLAMTALQQMKSWHRIIIKSIK